MASKKTLPDATVLAWARLIRVSQSLLARVEGRLRKAGFPPLAWYDALLELKRAGKAGLRPFELQREMLLAQYGVSRLADRLATEGYITVHRHKADGRGQVLVISTRGRVLLTEMWPVYRAAIEEEFGARLDSGEAQILADLLQSLQNSN